MELREYLEKDIPSMMEIWNEVVREGNAFPQENELSTVKAKEFFGSQTCCGVAIEEGKIVGMYILHPNNVGRCGHICNASYAVRQSERGRGVGKALVTHCLERATAYGYRILQFNAVVASNRAALALYEKLGFTRLGVIPKGFRNKKGEYEDIIPHIKVLS